VGTMMRMELYLYEVKEKAFRLSMYPDADYKETAWLPKSQLEYEESEVEAAFQSSKVLRVGVPGWLSDKVLAASTRKSNTPRPAYEKHKNREDGWQTASDFSKIHGFSFRKNPNQYRINYSMVRGGRIECFLEARERTHEFGKYPTEMVTLAKWIAGVEMGRVTGKPVLLAVSYGDAQKVVRIAEGASGVYYGWGGRTDRGDAQDVEPVIHIPKERFMPIDTPVEKLP
jgi:hypothetical protein